jgi:hypothetical protein
MLKVFLYIGTPSYRLFQKCTHRGLSEFRDCPAVSPALFRYRKDRLFEFVVSSKGKPAIGVYQ